MPNTRFVSDACWPAPLRHDTTAYQQMIRRFRANRPKRVRTSVERRRPQRLTRAEWALIQPVMPSLLDIEPMVESLVEDAHTMLFDGDREQAISLFRQAEDLILDYCMEQDTTAVDEVLDIEDPTDEEAEAREHYVEALTEVSHGAFDDAMELHDRGRATGTLLKIAVEGGMVSLPEFTDAFDSPVMTSEMAAASMADAEGEANRRRLRRVPTAQRAAQGRMMTILSKCSEERRMLQLAELNPVVAEQTVQRDQQPRVKPEDDWTLVYQADIPQMRAAWLNARAAGDECSMRIIEALAKDAQATWAEMQARSAQVERVTIRC